MEKSCEECGSLNLSYDGHRGELICNNCGRVMEENLTIEQEYERREKQPNHNIKRNFSAGYQRDKRNEGYKEDPKIKEFLREIYVLENLLKEIIGGEWENMKKKTMDFLKYNYENNLPKTRETKVLIWAILISAIETEVIHLENQGRLPESRKYKIALKSLFNKEANLYKKAEKMRDKLLPIMAKIIDNQLNVGKEISWETYVIDLSRIDPKSRNIGKKGFHKLFSKESMLVEHSEAGWEEIKNEINLRERNIHNMAVEIAKMFIQANLIKERKIGKKEGLLCACAYLVCKQHNFKPLPLEEWAKFFEVSERCLDDRIRDIKNTPVPNTRQQSPMETQIKNKKFLLTEKAQKTA